MMKKIIVFLVIITCINSRLTAQISYPGNDPGIAFIQTVPPDQIVLENNAIRIVFTNSEKKITIKSFEDKKTKEVLKFSDAALFEVTEQDNTIITSDEFLLLGAPVISTLNIDSNSGNYSGRLPGKKISADFEHQKSRLKVHWEATLRDGSSYVQQVFTFATKDTAPKFSRITLLKFPLEMNVKSEGTVDGSPMVHKTMFFAIEHPLCKTELSATNISSYLPYLMPVVSTVWGTTPVNQLRRGFLYYVERERKQPYHQILHYNSWFDISWIDGKLNEEECLDRIKWFGDSLIIKRHVTLNAFLIDDGWDDNKTLWQFNSKFPDGFTKLRKAAESYHSTVGVWMSPIGGYGDDQAARIEYGNKQDPPFETNSQGFSLAGPVYYNRFKEVTRSFIKNYDISMFKFDGISVGSGIATVSGAEASYLKDVEAFLRLLNDLAEMKPDLHLSLTTGTWPSIYWLFYGDNIWHGGSDTGMTGEGSQRQQWITFRDASTYKYVVKRAPLYPLNSLMLDGICIADNGNPAKFEMNDKDISDEIWSFFATGTNLQELYINPHKLNKANWDCLAKAANWARENESVLTDVHWIGGDPAKGEVYGFAAWSPVKAVLSLRNPSNVEKIFEVDVANVFELPDSVSNEYIFYDVRSIGATGEKQTLPNGKPFRITLQPFEVKVFNALSQQ